MKPPYIRPPCSVGDQVRALLHLPNDEIAEKLNCSVKYVRQCRRGDVGPSRPARPGDWTPERIDALRRDWATGLSCSQIAARLGGITRNAVIGKVSRLGLPRRFTGFKAGANGHMHTRRAKPKVVAQPTPISPVRALFKADGYVPPTEELVIPLNERKYIQTLTESCCRWPIGDPQHDDFHFCGRKKIPGLPYCEVHARRAYQPPPPRRRELPIVAGNETVAA